MESTVNPDSKSYQRLYDFMLEFIDKKSVGNNHIRTEEKAIYSE